MKESWRDWPETIRLKEGLSLLLGRPNGRKMALLLGDEVWKLLDYKAHRPGLWRTDPQVKAREGWKQITGDK